MQPDFVAALTKVDGHQLTFAIHCFRPAPKDDGALAGWLFGQVLVQAARTKRWEAVATAFDELLRQRAMCAVETLPAAFKNDQVAFEPRFDMAPLDWDEGTTDGGFDGRALPRFGFTIRVAPELAQALPGKASFECRDRVDMLQWIAPQPVPARPDGLVLLLAQVPRSEDRLPWPASGWVPGPIDGYPWAEGARAPERGKSAWAIVAVRAQDLQGKRSERGGWIDARGGFAPLKAQVEAATPRDAATPTANEQVAGDGETAEVGDGGVAEVGAGGTAIAGDEGEATAGNKGTAIAGRHGKATAGMKGHATVGDGGTAITSHMGTSVAGDRGVARTGRKGNARAGIGGRVAGGPGAVLILRIDEAREERVVVGKGVKPDELYRFLPAGHAELYQGQPPGWVKAYS